MLHPVHPVVNALGGLGGPYNMSHGCVQVASDILDTASVLPCMDSCMQYTAGPLISVIIVHPDL